jgi:hypothetical protein
MSWVQLTALHEHELAISTLIQVLGDHAAEHELEGRRARAY